MSGKQSAHNNFKSHPRTHTLNQYTLILSISWTITIALFLIADLSFIHKTTKETAFTEAMAHFDRDSALRSWVASHGGIYILTDNNIHPNPYLDHITERDIITPSGRVLTLMNPAYMIRTLNEYSPSFTDITGHLTSLNPLRPDNKPDDWERSTLESFENGVTERLEFVDINNKPFLRYMRPLLVAKPCLKCHAVQGYKEGDIRGGINVNVPMAPYLQREKQYIQITGTTLIIFWLLGLTGIVFGKKGLREQMLHRDQAEQEVRNYRDNLETLVEERTRELKESLEKVKVLSGLLPICANCKKIRDDKGYWNQIESYIGKYSEATFSHGICPDCARKLYPENFQEDKKEDNSD